MQSIFNDLPRDFKTLEIELFFDLHIGSPRCNYKAITERIERVKNVPNCYCILGGDLINNSLKSSVGDVYEEPLTPTQQIKHAITMFEPIKNKILCVTSGNHERRTMKEDGIDLMALFSAELGISDKYNYTACVCFIRFGSLVNHSRRKMGSAGSPLMYSIYVTHGDGIGGRTIGGRANGLERRGHIIDTDIIVIGHTHSPMTFRTCSYKAHPQTHTVTEQEQVFVNASATVGYETYGEIYGMQPCSQVSPKIILAGDTKRVMVTL